jgi:hypothetical protein
MWLAILGMASGLVGGFYLVFSMLYDAEWWNKPLLGDKKDEDND